MDKVEYRELIRSIKNNYLKKDYEGVIEVSEQLDLDKIRENSILEIIAKAYEVLGRSDLARETLLIAYKRTPTGKRIAYNLTMLSIKLDDLDSAVMFYEDFCKMAPKDNQRLILKYEIGKAGGVPVQNLVKVLEKYNSREMDDRWEYELARLYHEMGDDDRCASVCDQIILWYANGEYEKKALELKNMHKALNPVQQARYEEIMQDVMNVGVSSESRIDVPSAQEDTPEEVSNPKTGHLSEADAATKVIMPKWKAENQAEEETPQEAETAIDEQAAEPDNAADTETQPEEPPVFHKKQGAVKVSPLAGAVIKPSLSGGVKQKNHPSMFEEEQEEPAEPEPAEPAAEQPEKAVIEAEQPAEAEPEVKYSEETEQLTEEEPEAVEVSETELPEIDYGTEHLDPKDLEKEHAEDPKEEISGQMSLHSMFEAFRNQSIEAREQMNKIGEDRAAQIFAEVTSMHDSSILDQFNDDDFNNEPVDEVIEPEVPLLNREDQIKPVEDGGVDLGERAAEFPFEKDGLEEEPDKVSTLMQDKEQSLDATQYIPKDAIAAHLAMSGYQDEDTAGETEAFHEEVYVEEIRGVEPLITEEVGDEDTGAYETIEEAEVIDDEEIGKEEVITEEPVIEEDVIEIDYEDEETEAYAEEAEEEEYKDNGYDNFYPHIREKDLFVDGSYEEVEIVDEELPEEAYSEEEYPEEEYPEEEYPEEGYSEEEYSDETGSEKEYSEEEYPEEEFSGEEYDYEEKESPETEEDLTEMEDVLPEEPETGVSEEEYEPEEEDAVEQPSGIAAATLRGRDMFRNLFHRTKRTQEKEPEEEEWEDPLDKTEEEMDALPVMVNEMMTEHLEEEETSTDADAQGLEPLQDSEWQYTEATEAEEEPKEPEEPEEMPVRRKHSFRERHSRNTQPGRFRKRSYQSEEPVEPEEMEEPEEMIDENDVFAELLQDLPLMSDHTPKPETAEAEFRSPLQENSLPEVETLAEELVTKQSPEMEIPAEESAAKQNPEADTLVKELVTEQASETEDMVEELVTDQVSETEDMVEELISEQAPEAQDPAEGIIPEAETAAAAVMDDLESMTRREIPEEDAEAEAGAPETEEMEIEEEEIPELPVENAPKRKGFFRSLFRKDKTPRHASEEESAEDEATSTQEETIPETEMTQATAPETDIESAPAGEEPAQEEPMVLRPDTDDIPEEAPEPLPVKPMEKKEPEVVLDDEKLSSILRASVAAAAASEKTAAKTDRPEPLPEATEEKTAVTLPEVPEAPQKRRSFADIFPQNAQKTEKEEQELDLDSLLSAIVIADIPETAAQSVGDDLDLDALLDACIVPEQEPEKPKRASAKRKAGSKKPAASAVPVQKKEEPEHPEQKQNPSQSPDLDALLEATIQPDAVKQMERKQMSFEDLFEERKNSQPDAVRSVSAQAPVKKPAVKKPYKLSKEQRKDLGEFLLIDGMEEAICTTIDKLVNRKKAGDETGGHLIVTGDAKTGKTFLTIEIIKAVNEEAGYGNPRVAKVQSQALNGKNIRKVLSKVTDSDLIIENIGRLEDDTVQDLISAVRENRASTMVVLEGNELAADTLIQNFPAIGKIFKTRINIGELTLTQWADVAMKYAAGQGYKIDGVALLALHARIDEINTPDMRLGFSQVRNIVDQAIDRAESRNDGKLFGFSRKNGDELIELLEDDFI